MVSPIITTTLPTIIGMGITVEVVRRVFPIGGKGSGKGSRHYHYKGRSTIGHTHPGGHISHMHRGMKGYGRTKKSLRR